MAARHSISPPHGVFKNLRKFSKPAHIKASFHLKTHRYKIKHEWEGRVLTQLHGFDSNGKIILSEVFGIFFDDLIDMLESNTCASDFFSDRQIYQKYKKHFSNLRGCCYQLLIKEFGLLREVLHEELHGLGLEAYTVRSIIDKAIDQLVPEAVDELVTSQSASAIRALESAQLLNKSLEQFAGTAAHDLKSPLATISGYLTLLSETCKENKAEAREYVDIIQGTSERMRNLIDSLLHYARLSRENRPFSPTSVLEVLRDVEDNLHHDIVSSHATITYTTLPNVLGDKNLLIQLFQNLISNSIKFHADRPTEIHIQAQSSGEMFLFSVKDNGKGFNPIFKTDIFNLYRKLNGSGNDEGDGIGLATCKKVVELHGGTIWADSKPGEGAIFYFTLPKIDTDARYH